MNIAIIPEGTRVNTSMEAGIERLLNVFSSTNPPIAKNLQALLDNKDARIIVALSCDVPASTHEWSRIDEEQYLGVLTLLFVRTMTRDVAHIEQVAVAPEMQGQGIGTLLTQKAIGEYEARGFERIDLTSGEEKKAAHRVYGKLGFRRRETINWRYGK